MLSFRQLEVVRAVCLHGSATLAADALGISQPAISGLLRACAKDAGFPLFARRQGRLQPTAETAILLADLDLIFDSYEHVNRLVHDMRDSSLGFIKVAATPVLADHLLPAAIARFHGKRPRTQIILQGMDNLGVVNAVLQNRVDFGVILTPFAQPEGRLVDLLSADMIAVVNPSHPLAGRRIVTPADLAPYPLISFSRSLPLGDLVEQAFRQAGLTRRVAFEVNQSSAACALARASSGVAITDPFFLIEQRDHGVACLALRPRTPVKAQILIAKNANLSRPARLLVSTLREAAGRIRIGA